jgi:hypothetical protein
VLSNLIEILELATVVLLFSCALDLRRNFQEHKKDEPKNKKVVKKKKLTKEEKKEQQRLQTLIDNIDNYTGDGIGQKEVK